jgi:hypothetical protein
MDWNKAIFLAHASEDKSMVRTVYKKLKTAGLEPWLDEENLMPGVRWDNEIKEAIKKARFFMACISSKSVGKNGYVQKELRLALSELEYKSPDFIYFIPALIEDVDLPNISVGTINLRDYQAAKIFDNQQFNRLIIHLQKQANVVAKIKERENPDLNNLRTAVSNGQIETSLRILSEYVKYKNNDLQNSVTLLASRYNKITKENILGLVSQEQYSVESNKVSYSLLEIVKILEEEDVNNE